MVIKKARNELTFYCSKVPTPRRNGAENACHTFSQTFIVSRIHYHILSVESVGTDKFPCFMNFGGEKIVFSGVNVKWIDDGCGIRLCSIDYDLTIIKIKLWSRRLMGRNV